MAGDHLQLGGPGERWPIDDLDAGQPCRAAGHQVGEFVTGRHPTGGREDELVPRRLQTLELGVDRCRW